MSKWRQFWKSGTGFTVAEDPFGYSVLNKPRFFLQGWLERLIAKISMPDDQQRLLEELGKQGSIVYAVKYRSQADFVYLSLRLYQLGLPTATFLFDSHPYLWQPRWYSLKVMLHHLYTYLRRGALPDPYDEGYYREKIRKGEPGLVFLVGERGYYRSTVHVEHDPLEHLLDIQRESERPIFIVPLVLLYTKHRARERTGFWEAFLGRKEQPGPFRRFLSFLQGYSDAVLEVGEPLDLKALLPQLSEEISERRKQVFQVRRTLIEATDEIRRAIIGPILKSKLELKEIILRHPKLEAFMQRRAKSSDKEIWKVRMEADGYLDEIAAMYSYTMFQVGERILSWMWSNLFDGIEVDVESLQQVKRAARHSTLVYIPCHKSHIDYLILTYILLKNNLSSPFIAAGKNLAFWPLGAIFRRGGAFFIRRSFKGQKFYAEVFSLYVKTMVQLGHNIEFFIEGGRSRTGKMILPKMGLLAILIQAVEEGFCDDLVFVPTSICYDRIPEEDAYLKEITGGSKAEENIGQLVRARRVLKKRYGRVYVRFAEPVSLQRYMERFGYDSEKMPSKERHAMYRNFAYRIINSINQSSLVTPHALVASALLSSARHGVSKAEFLEVCKTFYEYLVDRKVGLSRTFRTYDATIEETLYDIERGKLIGKLKDEDDDLEEEVFTVEDEKRLALEYYKNNIIHFLLPAAYVSTSILAQQTFRFSVSQVLEDVAFMKNFYKFEFVYDNEIDDANLAQDVLDTFEDFEWINRISEGDQPYLLTHRGLRVAHAFHGILRNYFEAYWLVLRACRYLSKKPYAEKDFIKKVMGLGHKALQLELIERPESISKIIFGNAMNYYIEKGVIERFEDPGEKGKEKGPELFTASGNRLLVHHYSKQISRFLRSPHFTLQ